MARLQQMARRVKGRGRLAAAPAPARRVVARVRREGLTFLDINALLDLHGAARRIAREGVQGVLIEAGCARGGSAIVLADGKERDRTLLLFDVFGLIPPPSELDEDDVHERYQTIVSGKAGKGYYGYETDLRGKVAGAFGQYGMPINEHRIELIEGRYEDTLFVDEPVALAHIDCDWYESVMTCLTRIEPRLVPGGVLVIDDYHSWSGCRKAVDEYFADKRAGYSFVDRARLQIIKLPPGEASAGNRRS